MLMSPEKPAMKWLAVTTVHGEKTKKILVLDIDELLEKDIS